MTINFLTFQDLATKKIKNQDWITVKEAAEKNNISRNMMYWLIKHGRIPDAVKIGNQYVVKRLWKYRNKRKGEKHGPKLGFRLENPDKWKYLVNP
ncbi:MAG TPA: helix-turn-helix domain-containing protein [Alphaproteobacteria bacterium]|nr:helix-turn-helix domain-containing protein [Alphaproteobacteria bacterium]